MVEHGCFIVVEGLEGAGKSTALDYLYQQLTNKIDKIITVRDPGGTVIADQIRTLIKTDNNEIMDPRCELLLFYAARVQLVENVIKPALKNGTWVLCDRFELSTLAYQGYGRNIDFNIIKELSTFCVTDCQPNYTIYLDINPENGLERVQNRGKLDRLEQESLTFFKKIRSGYLEEIRTMANVLYVDANQSLSEVQSSLNDVLKKIC